MTTYRPTTPDARTEATATTAGATGVRADRFGQPLDPLAESTAQTVARRAPGTWRAPAATAVAAYVAVVLGLAAIGWLIVHTPLGEPVRTWDETLSRNVALWRTSGWEDVSSAGTSGADTLPVVAGMVVITAVLAALRRWRDLLFIPLALALELSIFLTVNYLVARDRPDVPQLGDQPGTHSFPSGHVAATFVLWFGIAVLLGVGRWRWPWRILAWALAALPVLTVAFSRVYRGMHFTTDVMAGLAARGGGPRRRRGGHPFVVARRHDPQRGGRPMTTVAVVCHAKKSMGGGLDELRSVLAHEGVEPLWFEVPKSRKAPAAMKAGGARGSRPRLRLGRRRHGPAVPRRRRRSSRSTLAILPAGTANLLATNLGIPTTIEEAVQVGLHGRRRPLDVGEMNGEHFAVMAGAGLDALMIRDADRGLKDKAGRLAYVWTGIRNVKARRVPMTIDVDGQRWFKGEASCVLVANVSTIVGGLAPFEKAEPDDGVLEVGVVEAEGAVQWARVFGRMAVGRIDRSPLTRTTSARRIDVRTKGRIDYELDGGHRGDAKKLKIRVQPAAVRICVPVDTGEDRS